MSQTTALLCEGDDRRPGCREPIAAMQKRPPTNEGTPAFKRCPVCHRQVLSAYRGEVTAVGRSEILSVTREGNVVGQCECGGKAVWVREIQRR